MTLAALERARRELRSLAQFLDAHRRWSVVTDFEDDLGEARSADLPLVAVGVDRAATRIDFVFPDESEADAVITVLHDIERAAAPITPSPERSLA